jgi:CubicO group peptidase (beta-lactamase class C family)
VTATADVALGSVRALLDAEVERGLETGVQLSVSYRGRVVDTATGENGAGGPLTVDTSVPWTCSAKPLGALAFGRAWESGAVELDTRVADVLPEFVGGGKDGVRVRDLLTHTTGLAEPLMALSAGAVQGASWAQADALIWSVICGASTETAPGTAMNYNPVTHWFVLDRLLNALDGGSPGDSYRTVLDLLGLTATLGVDWAQPPDQRVTVVSSETSGTGLEYMELASVLPLPGVGVWGTMQDLRVVGEVLLAGGALGERRVVGTPTVEALTSTHWPGSGHRSICDTDFPYGLGLMTQPALFGRRCSVRTFGHAGGNTSTLLVDPLFDLVVAVYWNGRLDDVRTVARRYALVRALYDDLDLPRLPVTRDGRPAGAG